MFLVDYIIILTFIFSFFFGLVRGVCHEIISFLFWLFMFFFFNNYYYFYSFYIDAIQNIFVKNNILIFIIIFFLLFKIILNFLIKYFIRKNKLFYYDIFLGGFFGIIRSIILCLIFLYFCNNFDAEYCKYYINNSILIFYLFQFLNYVSFFLNIFFTKLSTLLV